MKQKLLALLILSTLLLSSCGYELKKKEVTDDYHTVFKQFTRTSCQCVSWAYIDPEDNVTVFMNCEETGLDFLEACRVEALEMFQRNLYCRSCLVYQWTE